MASSFVTLDNGTCWPHPEDPSSVEWRLRYGEPSKSDLLVAASYIEAYRALFARSQRSATDSMRMVKAATRPAAKVSP